MKLSKLSFLAITYVLLGMVSDVSSICLPLKGTISRFGNAIFKRISEVNFDENVVHSPISGYLALLMLMQTADGYTKLQLWNLLCYSGSPFVIKNLQDQLSQAEGRTTIKFSSKLYVGSDAKGQYDYKEVMKSNFKFSVEYFEPTKVVKTSVYTNKDLLLYNSFYIEAKYDTPFDTLIPDQFFHITNDNIVSVNLFQNEKTINYANVTELDAEYIEMPFENKDLKMIIILPSPNNTLTELSNKLQDFDLTNINVTVEYVSLFVPRITIKKQTMYRTTLEQFGVIDVFTEKAKLNIVSQTPLMIDNVIQETVVDIGEAGVNFPGAYNTLRIEGGYGFEASKGASFTVLVNRPFYFAINSLSQGTLFEGHLVNPLVKIN